MKYYKLYAAINPLEKNCYHMVYDTAHMNYAPELCLKQVRLVCERYLSVGIDCYIRGFEEFPVSLCDD